MNIIFTKFIENAVSAFNLNLKGKTVLTEAATGNYVVTPIIAAKAGARVIAFTKESRFGTVEDVKKQTLSLAEYSNVKNSISIFDKLEDKLLSEIDIVTNTGFLRPIDSSFIELLPSNCVIPLMWEPWEYRPSELDINACEKKGIKVYGTNESDNRLSTLYYIGYTVLYFLLKEKRSPFYGKVLIVGSEKFANAVNTVLSKIDYDTHTVSSYSSPIDNISEYSSIILCEHEKPTVLIGNNEDAFIPQKLINENQLTIHISGKCEIKRPKFKIYPEQPAQFGYMSYTTDFIDPTAVINLHTAGLKVAEGMLQANAQKLNGEAYKLFLEKNYPALAFENEKYW